MEKQQRSNHLTRKDVFLTWLRWNLFVHIGTSTERLQALGICGAFAPVLKKLYPNKDDLSKALKRHMYLFNTQLDWGGIIGGAVLALEEEKATSEAEVPEEIITGFKTGLMGPMAGIGDTIDWLTLSPILVSMFLTSAKEGSVVACIAPVFIFAAITTTVNYTLFHLGYKAGRSSVANLLHGEMVSKIITGTSIMGLFMMGSLAASFVKVSTPLVIENATKTFEIQGLIDTIAPGILPLATVLLTYLYLEKVGNKYLNALMGLLVIGIVLGSIGIL